VAQPQRSSGGILTQRVGPLATWVWLLIGTIGIVVYYVIAKYRSNKADSKGQASAGEVTGAQNVPDIILQNTVTQTANPTVNLPPPTETQGGKPPAGDGSGGDRPPPKKGQKYKTITVGRWNSKHAPWNSTLWGIAEHEHVKGGYKELAKINHIKNPNLIYPGQKIKVPVS
jgi:nucleoid-associated protein YgaU